jgi:hypothetical protein
MEGVCLRKTLFWRLNADFRESKQGEKKIKNFTKRVKKRVPD